MIVDWLEYEVDMSFAERRRLTQADYDRLYFWVDTLLHGDDTYIDDIILFHVEYARLLCIPYIVKHPHRVEEIRGAAKLGLVKAVHWSYEGRLIDHKITMYIRATVRSHIQKFIERDRLVPVPKSRFSNHEFRSEFTLPVVVQDDDMDWEDHSPQYHRFVELVEAMGVSDRDGKILGMLAMNYTQQEVADVFSISQQAIQQIRVKMQKVYRRTFL